MDIPQVLAVLRPGEDWGPCAQTGVSYAEFAKHWRGASAVPAESEMRNQWADIVSNQEQRERIRSRALALSEFRLSAIPSIMLERAICNALRRELNRDRTALGALIAALRQLLPALPANVLAPTPVTIAELYASVAAHLIGSNGPPVVPPSADPPG